MRTAWAIAAKDLKERLRDRSAYIIGIVAPLALALVFGFILSPVQDYQFEATFGVVDLDGGPIAELFVEGTLAGSEGVELLRRDSVESAMPLVDRAVAPFGSDEVTAEAVFIIPAGFSDDVQSDRPVTIQVIGNESSEVEAGVAVAMAQGFASQMTSVRVAVATVEEVIQAPVDRLATGVEVLGTESPASIVDVTAATKQLDPVTFYAAGMAVFFVFFTVQFGVTSLLEERHAGTLSRLLVAPIPKWTILAGKSIGAFIVGVVSVTVLVIATALLVDAEWGSPLGVAALILAAVIAAMGIVALVSAFARTAEQAGAFASLVAIILGFLGGTFFDLSQAGGWIADVRFVSPHAWFLRGLADLSGGDVGVVVVPVLAMLAFGLVAGAIGMANLRKGLRP